MKRRYRILDANITHVSLCRRGKNRLPVLVKSEGDQQSITWTPLVKYDEDKGEMLTLVTIPEHFDSDGDVSGPEVVKKMCDTWALNGGQVDINHDLQVLSRDQVFVAENYIVSKGDERFEGWVDLDGEPVDATGGWAQRYVFLDEDLKKAAREGEIGGVSLYGPAQVETLSKMDAEGVLAELASLVRAHRESADPDPSDPTSIDLDMKPEELKAMLGDFRDDLLAKVDEKLAPVLAKATDGADDQDDQAGDPPAAPDVDLSDPEALTKYEAELRLKKAQAEIDWNDPDSVAKYRATLTKSDSDDSDDVSPAPRRSNVDDASPTPRRLEGERYLGGGTQGVRLHKSMHEYHDLGRLMAADVNKARRAQRSLTA
jgi:hypothetical protein